MRFSWILLLMLVAGHAQAQDRLYADEFPLGDVTLLDGPLKKARDLNIKTLLQYDNDRLLAPYLKEAGLTPKGKSYPNWDGLDGHVGGHYLTAMAINAATGSDECRQRLEYWISELQACADANAKGRLSRRVTSDPIMVLGYLSIIFIRCMLVCVMPGFTAAMSRLSNYFLASATGPST